MKRIVMVFLLAVCAGNTMASASDTLVLDLKEAIALAQRHSPSAQRARSTFLAAYWQYRYFRANYLPSVTLTSSPYLNKEMNKIVQSDGTARFIRQDQLGADLTLKVNQNIGWTGGSLFVKSTLHRIDELRNKTTAFSSQPLIIGYEQTLGGYNALKWDRRIEPLRYSEAKKQYAETLESIAAGTCSRFFALASAQTSLDMARQNFAAADTLFSMAQGRYRIGTITENEMLQLEINRLNEETGVMDAQVEVKEAQQDLRSFLGLTQDTEIRLLLADSVPAFDVPVQQAVDLALAHSATPDYYRRLRQESAASLAQARANRGFRADLYVQFGLSQTGDNMGSVYRHLLNQEYASVSLTIPILDWGRGRGKVRVAQSQLDLTRTQAEQGMTDFTQGVQKLVLQFNMQARKVHVAALTDRRAEQRHHIARRLYIMGRNSLLDLNAAVNEKNAAKRQFIYTLQTYWTLYFTLRSMTAYDFERRMPLTEQLPIH